jgi:hypothetical protein
VSEAALRDTEIWVGILQTERSSVLTDQSLAERFEIVTAVRVMLPYSVAPCGLVEVVSTRQRGVICKVSYVGNRNQNAGQNNNIKIGNKFLYPLKGCKS